MPKLKPGTISPTDEEDAAITAAALAAPDTVLITPERWARMRARVGRPPDPVPKERITIRLATATLARFRAGGPGWQARIDAALADWLATKPPAR